MGVNWKVRLRHPAFYLAVVALLGLVVTDTGFMELGRFENYAQMLMAVLVAGGVIADPTTKGISDSQQALTYDRPRDDGQQKR